MAERHVIRLRFCRSRKGERLVATKKYLLLSGVYAGVFQLIFLNLECSQIFSASLYMQQHYSSYIIYYDIFCFQI